ncbi:MAG TPA: hypothetical protein VN283_03360 [Thiobacillus sp.]|nr:hypothetical protein [Thiobacillus sp.]
MKPITGIVLVGLMLSCVAQAASFDCAKAQTKVEKLVCADLALSKQDEVMLSAYQNAYKHTADPAGLKIEQRKWLGVRNACKDIDCLITAYSTRLTRLNEILAQPKPCFRLLERKWPEVQSGHYPVCVAYLKNLNQFCKEVSSTCEYKLDPEIKELAIPDWEAIDPIANLELIAGRVKWRGGSRPPSENYWQVIKPEVLRRIDQGMVRLWQTRIRLASNEEPVRVIRADLGCEPIVVVGPDRAQYQTANAFVIVVDEGTGQLDRRYDYLLHGVEDVVLHDGQSYLLLRSAIYGDDLVLEEPFSARGGYEKGMNSVCVFEPQKK